MVSDRHGEEWPPHHSFVDVDSPADDGVGEEECVAYASQNDVVVVFAG